MTGLASKQATCVHCARETPFAILNFRTYTRCSISDQPVVVSYLGSARRRIVFVARDSSVQIYRLWNLVFFVPPGGSEVDNDVREAKSIHEGGMEGPCVARDP